MANKIYAQCPQCKKEANKKREIDELFGWRVVNGEEVPQSWCYECRAKERRNK